LAASRSSRPGAAAVAAVSTVSIEAKCSAVQAESAAVGLPVVSTGRNAASHRWGSLPSAAPRAAATHRAAAAAAARPARAVTRAAARPAAATRHTPT
jgi:hypothetical protein